MKEKKCWICGDIANSAEHSFKKTDLKTLYGDNPEDLIYIEADRVTPLQSINSKYLKHKVLCKYCNNTFTQPFDKAYEQFINYIDKNMDEIVYKRYIDFAKVYNDNWIESQLNLFKYLVKNLGCRLARFDDPIPNDLVELLHKQEFRTKLKITFAINEKALQLYYNFNKYKSGIGNSPIGVNQKYLDGVKELDNDSLYIYTEYYDWIEIHYYYNSNADKHFGSEWIADKQFIYLGSSEDTSFIKSALLFLLKEKKFRTKEEEKLYKELLDEINKIRD